jgi:hypothetical protein
LRIDNNREEVGRRRTTTYEKLGLLSEDEKERKAREEACKRRDPGPILTEYADELVCGDQMLDENFALCDWMNPIMELENRYKDMPTFDLLLDILQ